MTPSLIIGLGGAGQWALVHFKKNLLETHSGQIPNEVRLLAFDCEPHPQPGFDGVQLWMDEYVCLSLAGGLGSVTAWARRPYIASWFALDWYLRTLPPVALTLPPAATRQLARLLLFHDAQTGHSYLRNSLTSVLTHIGHFAHGEQFPVFIVGSLAGSIGSGFAIDVAYLARQIAYQQGLNVTIHGCFVLPEVFAALISDPSTRRNMHARAFAAVREINRFQTTFDSEAGYPMHYQEQGDDPIWRGRIRGRLFDSVAYLDGCASQLPMAHARPDMSVTSAIADMLGTMLSDPAVHAFAIGGGAGYNTFGCHTFVFPIHEITELMTCRLALETLDCLLAPVKRDEDGMPTQLAPDQNAEAGIGWPGGVAVARFLTDQHPNDSRDPYRVQNARLLAEIAEWSQQCGSEGSRHALVMELASRDRWTWQQVVAPQPLYPSDIEQILNILLRDECNLEKIPLPELAQCLAHCIEQFKRRFIGSPSFNGKRTGGMYGQSLEICAARHIHQFKQILNHEAVAILNGLSIDPRQSKPGKMGYLLDFLHGLDKVLTQDRETLHEAWQIQHDMYQQACHEAIRAAYEEMLKQCKGPFAFLNCRRAARVYLETEQRLIDRECAAIALQTVIYIVEYMHEHLHRLLYAIEELKHTWIQGSSRFGSGFRDLLNQCRAIEDRLANGACVATHQLIRDQEYEALLYARYAQDEHDAVADILKDLSWELSPDDQRLALRLALRGQAADQATLVECCRQVFADAVAGESLLGYLMNAHPNPQGWADQLLSHSEPQLSFQRVGALAETAYLHIANEQDPAKVAYLNQAIAYLNARLGVPVHLVPSSDRFMCSLIRTLQGISLEQTTAYQQGKHDYLQSPSPYDKDRSLLHIFPAEANAVRLEQQLHGLGQPERLLDDRATILLEDMGRVRQFVLAYAFNLIQHKHTVGGATLRLLLPPEDGSPAQDIGLTEPGPNGDRLTTALRTFAYLGRDVQRGRSQPIDYERVDRAIRTALDKAGLEPIKDMTHRLETGLAKLTGVELDLASVLILQLHEEIRARG